ncbi:MAG: hypothetical protein ACKOJ7_04785 [Betaproteobacteria bacterium]
MRPLWTVAGHPVPDPGAWSARLRAGVALVLGCVVWAAALPVGWALKGWFGAPAPLAASAAPAAPAVAPTPAKAHADQHPAGTRASRAPHPGATDELWRLPVNLGLHPGLSLAWFRPLAPSSPGEQGMPGGVSLRVLGAYRHLAAWLDGLPPSLTVRSLKLSTVGAVAGEVPRVDGVGPVLAMEATLDAAPGRPAQEAPVYAAAAKSPARARDPFAAPWAASGLAPQPDAEPAWLQRHAPHPMEVVGVLAREGHTWALLQVDGRLLPLKETNP